MSSLLNQSSRNVLLLINCRKLSSFNRTRSGIFSILNNEVNIWSEQNWSELAKQINKTSDFPLPGQTGVFVEEQREKNLKLFKSSENNSVNKENLSYLLNRPLPIDNQANKLREACGAFYLKEKMENSLLNLDALGVKKNHFELKAVKCPLSLAKDFQNYFRSNSIDELSLTVLTISFKTENDMATWNDLVDNEREVLIKKFVDTAQELCSVFEKEGCWADFIDPSSGRPFKSPYSHATFYESDERYRKLGFEIIDYGCCKVISHHSWGTKTYVGCLLTTASPDSQIVKALTDKFNIE
ncbi:methylmalonic aciduria and homocystinuria type D mitochondrial [Brachionus plicatilis]|uniref:Methylmalonic aciduria and homocystinuria type D mitochondrial n=1 Tax=Brachionus plicatilis TaxID=10195 RepID=A0A3M7QQ40_BRAPC|nr:methylmalonic aciduria and homocystinuria type D mitochondrial [Brachionus plicatilis]